MPNVFGGGGGGGNSEEVEELAELQAEIAGDLFAQTGPLRNLFLGTESDPGLLLSFAQTGETPFALSPALTPLREATEAQFGVARENILSSAGARGGQLTDALVNLESDRARAIGGLEAPFRENLFNLASGAALGVPGQAISGLSSSANTFLQQAALTQQGDIAQTRSAGSLAGLGVGSAFLAGGGPGTILAAGLGGFGLGSLGKKF